MSKRTVDIVHRHKQPNGDIIRELACGHTQKQASGGKAGKVAAARCAECPPTKMTFKERIARIKKAP